MEPLKTQPFEEEDHLKQTFIYGFNMLNFRGFFAPKRMKGLKTFPF